MLFNYLHALFLDNKCGFQLLNPFVGQNSAVVILWKGPALQNSPIESLRYFSFSKEIAYERVGNESPVDRR
jgi:hypothetical protein